jgi:hypothetical protein
MIIFGMLPRVIWFIFPDGRQAPGISSGSSGSPAVRTGGAGRMPKQRFPADNCHRI